MPMQTPDDIYDQLLVLRSQGGDASALAELVRRWQPKLVRHAMQLTGQQDAAGDVVQATWLAIIHSLNRLDDPACFRRWAYRIVGNKCADWVRARQRDRAHTSPLGAEPADNKRLDDQADDDVALLRNALKQLTPEKRAVVSMFYFDEMSLEEIAEALALSVGTVKSRLYHARRELQTIFIRRPS